MNTIKKIWDRKNKVLCLLMPVFFAFLFFIMFLSHSTAESRPIFENMKNVTVLVIVFEKSSVKSTGSGFIVGNGEYVITNWHVVEGLSPDDRIIVKAGPDSPIVGTIKWSSQIKDLAIVKLDKPSGRSGASLEFGSKVKMGDKAYVLGYPGFVIRAEDPAELKKAEPTLTEGIISRSIRLGNGVNYFQTQAPVNPGNSGGPLFNDNGDVIGIVAMKPKLLDGQVSEGIGWAIQCDELIPELRALGISTKGGLPAPKPQSKKDGTIEDPQKSVRTGSEESNAASRWKRILYPLLGVGVVAIIVVVVLSVYHRSR